MQSVLAWNCGQVCQWLLGSAEHWLVWFDGICRRYDSCRTPATALYLCSWVGVGLCLCTHLQCTWRLGADQAFQWPCCTALLSACSSCCCIAADAGHQCCGLAVHRHAKVHTSSAQEGLSQGRGVIAQRLLVWACRHRQACHRERGLCSTGV